MLKLHGYFKDGCIIQRDKNFKVFGWCDVDAMVQIKILGKYSQIQTCYSKGGYFIAEFCAIKGGFDKYSIEVSVENECIVINDVVFGDVYISAGQSNMEWFVRDIESATAIYESYMSEWLRCLHVYTVKVKQDSEGFWGVKQEQEDFLQDFAWVKSSEGYNGVECTSAIGYIFCGEMQKKLNIPVAYISTAIGGSGIINWIPSKEFKKEHEDIALMLADREDTTRIGCIFNEKISPLKNLQFDGMIWYLGESNAMCGDAFELRYYQKTLVNSYRKIFGENFNILQMDIAMMPYVEYNAGNVVNESLHTAAKQLKNVVSCPIHDLPHGWFLEDKRTCYGTIHLTTKWEQGKRAAKLYYDNFVLKNKKAQAYVEGVEYIDNCAYVKYAGVKDKLTAKGKIFGFVVMSEYGKYYEAEAEILNENTVKVYNKKVNEISGVAYGFFPYNNKCNLRANGYPVEIFRTDLKRENLSKLISPFHAFACSMASQFESTFNPEFGGAREIETWNKGEIFGSKKIKIKHSKEGLNVLIPSDSKSYYYSGISPRLTPSYAGNCMWNYNNLEMEVRAEGEVEFMGLFVELTNGERLCFYHNQSITPIVFARNENKTITIDLTKANNHVQQLVSVQKEISSKIAKTQFVFRNLTEKNVGIIITKINLYD